ncbi:photosystem II reaction center protein T [Leptolyngbya sp. FACHB-261]|nr:photosystem II reaction center protein T [Leptolyngbya sp. FACHB-261]MBD2104645.1 photosystem II reaction center protein T [Leptolyngbya sp. FACHB-261]
MEAITYVLILAGVIGLLFFAIFFREPPRINKK